jgi:hypothetical protein
MGAKNSSDRIAATLYCLGTWFVSGICGSTLHKGYSDDDNNNNNIEEEYDTWITRYSLQKDANLMQLCYIAQR